MIEQPWIRVPIWLSLAAWSLAEWWRLRDRGSPREQSAARLFWTLGAVLALAHVAAAFHLHHNWSHGSVVAETARQTRERLGLDVGWGVYVNYAFVAMWLSDAAWWCLFPGSFATRSRALDRAVRLFILFVVVNGAIVFSTGPVRVISLVVLGGLAAAWYLRRGTGESRP